jgi:hypothetical protein
MELRRVRLNFGFGEQAGLFAAGKRSSTRSRMSAACRAKVSREVALREREVFVRRNLTTRTPKALRSVASGRWNASAPEDCR